MKIKGLTYGRICKGVTRLPNGSVSIYITIDGKPVRRRFGPITDQQAKDQREKLRTEAAEGACIKKKTRVTIDRYADAALANAQRNCRTWDKQKKHGQFWKAQFKGVDISTIRASDVTAVLVANMKPKGRWSASTANEYKVSLLGILNRALADDTIEFNAAERAPKEKGEVRKIRPLTCEEEAAIRAVVREKYPDKEVELDLSLHTGLRMSSVYGKHRPNREHREGLQWAQVDMDFAKCLIVLEPKGRKGESVSYAMPCNKIALAALKTLRERSDGTGAVVVKPSGLSLYSPGKWFGQALRLAKIESNEKGRVTWHSLRHTFAERLRLADARIEDIACLMNHSQGHAQTLHYADHDRVRNLDRLADLHRAVALLETVKKTDNSRIAVFRAVSAR